MDARARCQQCGALLVGDALFCARCGTRAAREASVVASLPALAPEAEPPLPADHDFLRSRTPPRGAGVATRVERRATPVGTPVTAPPSGVSAVEPSLEAVSLEVPRLTDGRRHRGLVVVLLLLAVGAVVGWLLSRDPPPTADEIRARGAQQHPQ